MSVISCKNVYLSYENNTVINDLNFEVSEGDYLCIVGENGSGKSTLIKAMLGLKQTASGHLHISDGFGGGEIGYLPQQTTVQKDFLQVCMRLCFRAAFQKRRVYSSQRNTKKQQLKI